MVDNRSGASSSTSTAVRDGLGKKGGWVPWLIGALLMIGIPTVVDLVFYREDIQDEAHEEEEHVEETGTEEEGEETDTGTNLEEPRDEDAEGDDSGH